MIEFQLPDIQEHKDGWGPRPSQLGIEELAEQILPQELKQVPYATFNKSDKLGRFADWSGQVTSGQRAFGHKNYQGLYSTGSSNVMFGFRAGSGLPSTSLGAQPTSQGAEAWSSATGGVFYDEDAVSAAGTFHMGFDAGMRPIASRRIAGGMLRQKFTPKSKSIQRPPGSFGILGGAGGATSSAVPTLSAITNVGATQRHRQAVPHRYFEVETAPKLRDFPIGIRPDWRLIEELELSKLNKVTFEVGEPLDL
jgi:translation initiation factor 3 subunit D